MDKKTSSSSSTIPSYLYDGLCEYGELCSCSMHGLSHSYSNEILRWSKKELEAYQKVLEDDACSKLPGDPPVNIKFVLESPSKSPPKTPPVEEEENKVVLDTPEELISARAKQNLKKRHR